MSQDTPEEKYADVTAAASAQLAVYEAQAQRLAKQAFQASSKDGRVQVRACVGGVTWLSLSEDILTRYSVGVLNEVVTRTVRAAQLSAAEAYKRGLAAVDLSAVAEADRIMAWMFEEIEKQQ